MEEEKNEVIEQSGNESEQIVFVNDIAKTVEDQASDIIEAASYKAAIQNEKLQKESVESASAILEAKNKSRINKAKEITSVSAKERYKNVTSTSIQSDEAHYKRHYAVLSRWGVENPIPKYIAIWYEIFGYALQFLFIITIGWIVYLAKFMCEIFSGLTKGVWAVIGSVLGISVLGGIVYGITVLVKYIITIGG